MLLAPFLFGTKWLKPRPVRCVVDPSGGDQATTLEVEVPGDQAKLRFYLPEGRALPSRVIDEGKLGTISFRMEEYATVGGVMLPMRYYLANRPSPWPIPFRVRYEIDPAYDPAFLNREPSHRAGPDAWRTRKRGRR